MGNIFRSPLIAPGAIRLPVAPDYLSPNLTIDLVSQPFISRDGFGVPFKLPTSPDLTKQGTLLPLIINNRPFFEPDWPLPIKVELKVEDFDPPNLILSTFLPTRPFFEPVWGLATPALPKVWYFDGPNLLLHTLMASIPVRNLEWSVILPRGKVPAFDPPNLVLQTLVPTVPFFNPQWTAIKGLPRAIDFDPPNINLKVPTSPFFDPLWDLPHPRMPKVLDFDPPLYPFFYLPPPPFSQLDWPLVNRGMPHQVSLVEGLRGTQIWTFPIIINRGRVQGYIVS